MFDEVIDLPLVASNAAIELDCAFQGESTRYDNVRKVAKWLSNKEWSRDKDVIMRGVFGVSAEDELRYRTALAGQELGDIQRVSEERVGELRYFCVSVSDEAARRDYLSYHGKRFLAA